MAKLGKSQREKDAKKAVSVAVVRDGKILFGLRGDSGKWNLPGGHMEPGETPEKAAVRELLEETGLRARNLERLGFCDLKDGALRVYSFLCEAEGEPDAKDDPDEEMAAFKWISLKEPAKSVMGNLHNKQDVTLQFLDVQEQELDLIWDEDAPRAREIERLRKAATGWKPAFQHRHTNQVVVTPGFHNTDLLPGGEFTDDWVDGFVDPAGRFYDREATQRQLQVADSFQLPDFQNRDVVGRLAAEEPPEGVDHLKGPPINKAGKSWRSKDGITIPAAGTPERAEWDQRYYQQLVQVFAQGNPQALRPLTIDPNDSSISGVNMAVNKDRLSLYRRMARAGDPLPPVIVRRSSTGWVLVDGNHRQEAAKQAKVNKLSAYEIVPLKSPPTKPFKKAVLDPSLGYRIEHKAHRFTDMYSGEPYFVHTVSAYAPTGEEVGRTNLGSWGKYLKPNDVFVHEAHRRKGIASAMYAHAEKVTGMKVIPSESQTSDGKALWAGGSEQQKQFGKSEKPTLDQIMARTKARVAYMRELDKAPKPSTWACRGGGHVVVSQDPSKPGRWRATRISAAGEPLGHSEAENHYEALKAAHYHGAIIEPPTPVQKFEQDLGAWLAKATMPEHFKYIAKAVTGEGPQYVDHTHQLQAHPAAIHHEVEHYRNNVLASHKVFSPVKGKEGITRKVIYTTRHEPQGDLFHPTRVSMDAKYMVKPYHEGLVKRIQAWQKWPIQGWAEMTNQALYHAGGIGHLHQKVHVSEHDMGAGHEKEPALVVHLEPGFRQVIQMHKPTRVGPITIDEPIKPTEQAKADTRKIAMMDFLTNNLDRHGGNLLIDETGNRVLAIDHSRSFQYFSNHKTAGGGRTAVKNTREMKDYFADYIDRHGGWGGIGLVDPYQGHDWDVIDRQRLENYGPTFDWWGEHGQRIRDAFEQQVEAIKDQKLRAHIRRNFHARADWLDERAKLGIENYGMDWHRYEVPQYKFEQRTDHEIEDERTQKLREEWAREEAEREAQKAKAG